MYRLTQVIAGTNAADRSERRRLEREQADFTQRHQRATHVSREFVPSPPKIYHQQSDPLRRCPSPIQLGSDDAMVDGTNALPPLVEEIKGPLSLIDANPVAYASDVSDEDVRRAYNNSKLPDPAEFAANMPAMPEMEGFGRYRMSKNASNEDRLDHLRRSTRNLAPGLIEQIGELGIVNKEAFDKLASEHSSQAGSVRSGSAMPMSQVEYIDNRRGSLVRRGFSSSTLSSSGISWRESVLYRRDSSTMSNSSTKGLPGSRRLRLSPRSDLTSPLRAVPEADNAINRASSKFEKPCEFNDDGDPDSAVASDDEEEWFDTLPNSTRRPATQSMLSESIRHDRYLRAGSRVMETCQQINRFHSGRFRARQSLRPKVRHTPSRVYNYIGADNKQLFDHIEKTRNEQNLLRQRVAMALAAAGQDPSIGSLAVSGARWEAMKAEAAKFVQTTRSAEVESEGSSCSNAETAYEEQPSDDEADDGPDDLDVFMVGPLISDIESNAATPTMPADIDSTSTQARLPVRRPRSDTVNTVIHHPSNQAKEEKIKDAVAD